MGLQGQKVRKAAYSVLRLTMENGAKGCEVTVSGKIQKSRAKSIKLKDGKIIFAGDFTKDLTEEALVQVRLRRGVMGIRVRIFKEIDRCGFYRSPKPMPDSIIFPTISPLSSSGSIADISKKEMNTGINTIYEKTYQ